MGTGPTKRTFQNPPAADWRVEREPAVAGGGAGFSRPTTSARRAPDRFCNTLLDWVAARNDTPNEIEVVNMSLSGKDRNADTSTCASNDPLHRAVCNVVNNEQTPVIVAAGNGKHDVANYAPAAYDEVFTVSAFADLDGEPGGKGRTTCYRDDDDSFANFSNRGKDIDICAPGVCIRSTGLDGTYKTKSGTSMATPHVTGAAALYAAANTGAMALDVYAWLRSLAASRPQNDPTVGLVRDDDPDKFPEPILYLDET